MKKLISFLTNSLGWYNQFNVRKYIYWSDCSIKVFYNGLSDNEEIAEYLYTKLLNIIKNEYDVNVFELEENDMSSDWCAGVHVTRKLMSLSEQKQFTNDYKTKLNLVDPNQKIYQHHTFVYPRIEINKKYNYSSRLITLCHELGHHLIYLDGIEQSEELADYHVLTVFKKYFDPLFLGIYNCVLSVNTKIECEEFVNGGFGKHYIEHYINSPYRKKFKLDLL